MAIKLYKDVQGTCSQNVPSTFFSKSGTSSLRFYDFDADVSTSSSISRKNNKKFVKKSPYLLDEYAHLLKIKEKGTVRKRINHRAPFPPVSTIYKANSDEFKMTLSKKTNKKSIMTLPNKQMLKPRQCTVSDMYDSEYFDKLNDGDAIKSKKKHSSLKKHKKLKKNHEIAERDFLYNSEMNVEYRTSSSTNTIKNCHDNRILHKTGNKNICNDGEFNAHDIWAVLRNINRFNFTPSLPNSESTIAEPKKKKCAIIKKNRKNNYNGTKSIIETYQTEEFACISSWDIGEKTSTNHPLSQSSSFDRVTIINNKDNLDKTYEVLDNNLGRSSSLICDKKIYKYPLCKNKKACNKNKSAEIKRRKKPKYSAKFISKDVKPILNEAPFMESSIKYDNELNTFDKVSNSKEHFNFILPIDTETSKLELSRNIEHEQENLSRSLPVTHCKKTKIGNKSLLNSKELNNLSITTKPEQIIQCLPVLPKFTTAEIRRLLELNKFPIVVTKIDSLSSTIKFVDFFNSYDIDSEKPEDSANRNDCNSIVSNDKRVKQILNNTHHKEWQNKINCSKKEPVQTTKAVNCSQYLNKTTSSHTDEKTMLQLLYKKPQIMDITKEHAKTQISSKNKAEHLNLTSQFNTAREQEIKSSRFDKGYKSIYPWAKARRTSDFIDRVIAKLKYGMYYDCEKNGQSINIGRTDDAMQTHYKCKTSNLTEMRTLNNQKSIQSYNKCDAISNIFHIPGFDETPPALEIKTLNKDLVCIKHCMTNIMVQFDVTVTDITNNMTVNIKECNPCIPLKSAESNKVFKCKTLILNGMLPAELCTIIPKMMNTILENENKSFANSVGKTSSHLSTITELSQCELRDHGKYYISKTPHLRVPTKNNSILLNGTFNIHINLHLMSKSCSIRKKLPYISTFGLLQRLPVSHLLEFDNAPIFLNKMLNSIKPKLNSNVTIKSTIKDCLPLDQSTKVVTLYRQDFNLGNSICQKQIANQTININLNIFSNIYSLTLNNNQYIDALNMFMKLSKTQGFDMLGSHLKINGYKKPLAIKQNQDAKLANCIANPVSLIANAEENYQEKPNVLLSKKKRFDKPYKKCKSSSNLTSEKGLTPLNKINNIDDFFQVLGCSKMLSSIFDEAIKNKILWCLAEMKTWLKEISSTQAMLILLLINKKDTSNLMRFRPVILQGIAVNRITLTKELDMEIEVIERENFSKLTQYEGFSYINDSMENYDKLLQELKWIAKTTASDYHRTFDETSEKLLNSLLQKRKKLNPSYLRVMARYVGLGLLKSPNKR